jgi:hypothetical protein
MDYESILHRAITRGESLKVSEAQGYPSLQPPDERRRGFIDTMESRGHLDAEGSKLLLATLGKIDQVAQKVRRARLTDLPGEEKRQYERQEITRLVSEVEAAKSKEIEKRISALDRLQAEYQLLALREAELDYSEVDERGALSILEAAKTEGYTPATLRVLASKGPKARAAAKALQATLPPWVANSEGLRTLAEIREITALGIGNIRFQVQGANVAEVVNVGQLISGFEPSIQDLTPTGEGVA